MVGNVATETLLAALREMGAELPEMEPLERLMAMSVEMEKRYGAADAVGGGDAWERWEAWSV